jgi:hypothetical protein
MDSPVINKTIVHLQVQQCVSNDLLGLFVNEIPHENQYVQRKSQTLLWAQKFTLVMDAFYGRHFGCRKKKAEQQQPPAEQAE